VPEIPSFEEYLASLGQLTAHTDPTVATEEKVRIKAAAASLAELDEITPDTLIAWAAEHYASANVLGLAVGLSHERLRTTLKHHLGTSGWLTLARERPTDLIEALDREFGLVRLIDFQRRRSYDFGDILVARASTRQTANSAAASGRKVEDHIEAIAKDLGLPCETRTRFIGRNHRTAPCDLVIPSGKNADIAVAAKGYDSTGSKLGDAVREIEEMADVRLPRQYIMAVIDGIGWNNRLADLKRIYTLWERQQIDGMYTLATLDRFRTDLQQAARLRGLLASND
jgi:hypothetical protein